MINLIQKILKKFFFIKYKIISILKLNYFIFGIVKLFFIVRFFDKNLPFKGIISKNDGFCKLSFDEELAFKIKKLVKKNSSEKNIDLRYLFSEEIIREIFDKIMPPVKDYLGKNCFLDGIYFSIINKEKPCSSISGNWHTDNVGARLKVFICFEGDGGLPTYIIPNKNRIPSIKDYIKIFKSEIGRHISINNTLKYHDEYPLKHSLGTIYIFDTQLLHRGAYEEFKNRSILIIEFSPINKHKIFKKSLGTQFYNSFKFNKNLLKINSFVNVLDPKRVFKYEDFFVYKDPNTEF